MTGLDRDGTDILYTYNADGLRTSKTINGIKFSYFWNGSKLTAQTNGDNNKWYFRYDGDTPIGFEFNGKEYFKFDILLKRVQKNNSVLSLFMLFYTSNR